MHTCARGTLSTDKAQRSTQSTGQCTSLQQGHGCLLAAWWEVQRQEGVARTGRRAGAGLPVHRRHRRRPIAPLCQPLKGQPCRQRARQVSQHANHGCRWGDMQTVQRAGHRIEHGLPMCILVGWPVAERGGMCVCVCVGVCGFFWFGCV
jgi:hypothetical protein